jgi:hypothetical protein
VFNPEGEPKWDKVLAHDDVSMSDFRYGTDTPSRWRARVLQVGLVCTPESGLIVVDADYPEQFAATRTGALLGRQHAMTVRDDHYHVGIDARLVPPQDWPTQGPVLGGDVKANGFVAAPGTWHWTEVLYQPTGRPLVPAWPGLMQAVLADRADYAAEAERERERNGGAGNGHGGQVIGGHDDYLTKVVVFGATMAGLRAGLAITDPRLEAAVYAAWWQAAQPPQDPSDPYEPEDWPRFWCARLHRKAMAEFAAGQQHDALIAAAMPGLLDWLRASNARLDRYGPVTAGGDASGRDAPDSSGRDRRHQR